MKDTYTLENGTIRPYYLMNELEFTAFLDKQATERKNRVCFDNYNKEGTYEYCLPEHITVGNYSYCWFIDSHKRRGRNGSTLLYVILQDTTCQILPDNFIGCATGCITLDKFSLGHEGLRKNMLNESFVPYEQILSGKPSKKV